MNITALKLANQLQVINPYLYQQAVTKRNIFSILDLVHIVEYRYFMMNHHQFKNTWLGWRVNSIRANHFYNKYGHRLVYMLTKDIMTKNVYNVSREYAKKYAKKYTTAEEYQQLNKHLTATA